jgi:MoxR-like ATPase
LDNQDQLLSDLNRQQAVLRDLVRAAALNYSGGLYLYGPAGTGKTHAVRGVLQAEGVLYAYQRGHVTPLGLYKLLEENAEGLTVLDDVGQVFRSEVALQILLAALEPKREGRPRRVSHKTSREEHSFDFEGAVICVSNLELHGDQLLEAFKSRVNVYHYAPPDAALAAMMLALAAEGWPAARPTLTPAECREVAQFTIKEMLRRGCHFDLRVYLDKALPLYQQAKDDMAESHWLDLVAAAVTEHLTRPRHEPEAPGSRDARRERERELLRQILGQHATREAQVAAWTQATGHSRRSFFNRLAELRND